MIGRRKQLAMIPATGSRAAIIAIASLSVVGLLPAQIVQNGLSRPSPQAAGPSDARPKRFPPLPAQAQAPMGRALAGDSSATHASSSSVNQSAPRLTLEQAQARARTIARPMAQLAQLQVEAARAARLAAQADYFRRIAMAKAGLPVAEAALNLEQNYHALLIAQRQLAVAKANDQSTHVSKLLASNRAAPGERARQLSELAHRMVSAVGVQTTGYARENTEFFLPKAKLEVEMFQADLEYRQALAGLKALIGER
jgi:hypothetical protein